jgi:hypothetical protein
MGAMRNASEMPESRALVAAALSTALAAATEELMHVLLEVEAVRLRDRPWAHAGPCETDAGADAQEQ